MDVLKKVYYFSIFSNILIALAAASQCVLTYIILGQEIDFYIVLIEGAATLALYNFSLILSKPQSPELSVYARTRWVFKYERLLWINTIIATLICLWCLFHIHPYAIFFLGVIGFVSVLYSLPIIPLHGRWGGLRQVPAMKIFHIALVWVLSSVFLPYIELYGNAVFVNTKLLYYLAFLKFIFLIICTLPFDIRDIKQDSYYHLRTLPSMLGEGRAKRLCYLLLGVHSLFILAAPYLLVFKIGLLLTNAIIYLLLRFLVFKTNEHYHYAYLLDVSLVLQFLVVVLVQCMI
ncbi:UbiA family prenyltransferase [Sphingobacterium sp. SG20118]|uniref:UbiA family prenyltransferase n=1 Tax=Sphingobacterium TaxID=28453 RepID=UPI00246910EF|nr:UbiA family prenyltransferase [Sphingobacterium faecium]MDH5825304.1 UbiA family prenyltransferase [Sphingobacterium faecium]